MWNRPCWNGCTLVAIICLSLAQGAPLDDAETALEAMKVKVIGIQAILESAVPEPDPALQAIETLEDAKAELDSVYKELMGIDFTLVTAENVNLIKEKTTSLESIRGLLNTNEEIVTEINAENPEDSDAFQFKLTQVDDKTEASLQLVHRLQSSSIPDLPLNSPFFISFVSVGALCVLLVLFGFVCICIINSGSLIKKVKPKNKMGKTKKLKKDKSAARKHPGDLWIEPNPNGGPYRGDVERQISMPPGAGSYSIPEPRYNQYNHPEPTNHNMIDVDANHYLGKNKQIILERGYGRRPEMANSNLHY
ncbi:hypothetical protein TCAL_12983 [Tigriopus californicus]|uniref:Uncharacterized protein n=1 Tax=Tigriopus californicus TaxID=6832 RepID=A0A553PR28_TIGCA|nr:uncharacterized protein LOC131881564 [Tigriopus californicus]TRY80147.1 hypothetical protein TCAL_12983 [Tigriopus californicus]|eukprot:TCALIF_12983-PA protein Name:"Protein of unknown function" AED:0.00 eAED:0.00 QI:223/1/1/1/0.5/1/3/138/306